MRKSTFYLKNLEGGLIYIGTSSVNNAKYKEAQVSISEQLAFFMPLMISAFSIVIIYPLINAGLARLPSPEIYISAFEVAKGVMIFVQSPLTMVRQTVTVMIDGIKSYYKVRRFIVTVVALLFLFFVFFAFSDLARWVFEHVIGIEGKTLDASVIILRIMIFAPVAVAIRDFNQGISILFSKTSLITVATVMRIASITIMILVMDKLILIPAVIAGFMLLSSVSTECITMFLGVRVAIGNISEKTEMFRTDYGIIDRKEITDRIILRFFWPLAVTSFIRNLAIPIINMGLARTDSPEIAISVYSVAWAVGMIFLSPTMVFHQVPLNFIRNSCNNNLKSVRIFAAYLGIILSSLIAIMSFTGIGYYVIRNIIGATAEISVMCIDVLRLMTVLPFIMIAREFYWGILMRKHMTHFISKGKVINLVALTLTIAVMTFIEPANPAVVGIVGMISSEGMEFLYLYRIARKCKVA